MAKRRLESLALEKLPSEEKRHSLGKLHTGYCADILSGQELKDADFRAVKANKHTLKTLFDIAKNSSEDIYILFPEDVKSGSMQTIIGTGLYIGPNGNIDEERLKKILPMIDPSKSFVVAYTRNNVIDSLVESAVKENKRATRDAEELLQKATDGTREARERLKSILDGIGPGDVSLLENMGWLPQITLEDIGYDDNIADPINGLGGMFLQGKHRAVLHAAHMAKKRLEKVVNQSIFSNRVEIDEAQINHAIVFTLHSLLSLDNIKNVYKSDPKAFRERYGNNSLFKTLDKLDNFDEYLKIGAAGILHDCGKWLDLDAYREDASLRDRFHPRLGANIMKRLKLPYSALVEGHHANLSGINHYPNVFNGHGRDMSYVPDTISSESYHTDLYFPRMVFSAYELLFTTLEKSYLSALRDNPERFEQHVQGLGFGSIDDYLIFKTVNSMRDTTLYPTSGEMEMEEPVAVEFIQSANMFPADSEVYLRQKKGHESKKHKHPFDGATGMVAKNGVIHIKYDRNDRRLNGTVDTRTGVESEIFDIELTKL